MFQKIIYVVGILVFLFSLIFVINLKVKPEEYTYQIDEYKSAGYGYSIFYNHRLLIKQKKIPVIQCNQKFHTKQDAGEVAELVIIKMKNGINPSISYEELVNLSITIK
ncbi:DUF4907 domain-containing protein [Christiangramia flava]|uniref:Uncharacterized protein n=1 Tax=Christiangramia flava JLT2011 TaxID=1229726 RepID=A0A1L7I3V0_9FLAO|nr:DUF4907 domain-containing protein [Christiangramia flava]APU67815.1 hypothetical protein GRFL_1091 [Christiangramia flava JLT2011]OSS40318.1 hypothetical protein C723_0626 [Christiangramia flava JLT2011]